MAHEENKDWADFWKKAFQKDKSSHMARVDFISKWVNGGQSSIVLENASILFQDNKFEVIKRLVDVFKRKNFNFSEQCVDSVLSRKNGRSVCYFLRHSECVLTDLNIEKLITSKNRDIKQQLILSYGSRLSPVQADTLLSGIDKKDAIGGLVVKMCKLSDKTQSYVFGLKNSWTMELLKSDFMPTKEQLEVIDRWDGVWKGLIRDRRQSIEANILKMTFKIENSVRVERVL